MGLGSWVLGLGSGVLGLWDGGWGMENRANECMGVADVGLGIKRELIRGPRSHGVTEAMKAEDGAGMSNR